MLQQEYASTGHGAPGIPVGLTGVCECTLSASLRGSSLCAMDMTRVGQRRPGHAMRSPPNVARGTRPRCEARLLNCPQLNMDGSGPFGGFVGRLPCGEGFFTTPPPALRRDAGDMLLMSSGSSSGGAAAAFFFLSSLPG